MGHKVTVIGAGSVGSTIAYTMAVKGIATEIVLIDINEQKALGEALDIRQGVPFCPPVSVYAGSFSDAKDSEIVILTSGIPRKPGQSRLELAQVNVDVCKSIMQDIVQHAPNAVYIIVSNPVDILTYVFQKYSGLPEKQIIGSGTMLDTARLRARIAQYYSINQQNVHAYVFGEHGDTSFVPWSMATISSVPLHEFRPVSEEGVKRPEVDRAEVEEYIRASGGKIIARKGATFYAVSISVCHIAECIFSGADTAMTVSNMMHGEYGIEDVSLSILSIIGRGGLSGRILVPLPEQEQRLLRHSAESLKAVIRSLGL